MNTAWPVDFGLRALAKPLGICRFNGPTFDAPSQNRPTAPPAATRYDYPAVVTLQRLRTHAGIGKPTGVRSRPVGYGWPGDFAFGVRLWGISSLYLLKLCTQPQWQSGLFPVRHGFVLFLEIAYLNGSGLHVILRLDPWI